ncbi:hypothetical protein V5F01_42570 [Streptomyces sp. NRRL B-2790]|uniref:hypothetical protein n=1 Tax=Streptomyces sp. NRRL B-2790 TaxID=1463835 RepID=UPI003568E587
MSAWRTSRRRRSRRHSRTATPSASAGGSGTGTWTYGRGGVHRVPQEPDAGSTLPVLDVPRMRGRFGRVEVNPDGLRAVPVYTADGLSVRLVKR